MHTKYCIVLSLLASLTFYSFAQDEAPAPVTIPGAAAEQKPAEPQSVQTPPAPTAEARTLPEVSVAPESQLITVTLDDVPLPDVVKLFTKIAPANIIAATTNLQGNVTASLQDVAWRPAFEAILERQGLLLVEKPAGSNIFVIEARPPGADVRVTETILLKHAKVDKLSELLKNMFGAEGTVTPFPESNAVLMQAPQQKITEAKKVIEALDTPRRQVYIEARFVEMTAAASKQLGLKWDSLTDWGVTASGLGGGAQVTRGQLAAYKEKETKRPLFHFKSDGTLEKVTFPFLENETKYVSPDAIIGTPLGMQVADSGLLEGDMSWRSARSLYGQISANNFRLALSAFEKMNGVSLVSNPKIIVANEESAVVDMTTKEPYVKVTANRSTSGGGNTLDITTELGTIPGKNDPFTGEAFFSYGVTLKVTPRISSAGIITITIEPSLSEWTGDYEIKNTDVSMPVTRYPIIQVKRINTMFTMQDGNTAVIGGLTKSRENNIDSGIPYLREIPYIGPHLFGWKSRQKEQIELIIFVTVGIVDPEQPIDENVGLPKNAILTRELKEPGDSNKAEWLLLKP